MTEHPHVVMDDDATVREETPEELRRRSWEAEQHRVKAMVDGVTYRKIKGYARTYGCPDAEVIRRALEAFFRPSNTPQGSAGGPE